MAKKKTAETGINEFVAVVSVADSKFKKGLYIRQVTFHPDVPIRNFDVLIFANEEKIVASMVCPHMATGIVKVYETDDSDMHELMADCVVNVNNVPIRVTVEGVTDEDILDYAEDLPLSVGSTIDDDEPEEETDDEDDEDDLSEDDAMEEVDDTPAPKSQKKGKPAPVDEEDDDEDDDLPFGGDDEDDDEDDSDLEADDEEDGEDVDEEDDIDDEEDDLDEEEDDLDDEEDDLDDDAEDDLDDDDDDEVETDDEEDDEVETDDEEDDEVEGDDEDEVEDDEIDVADIRRKLRTSNSRTELVKIATQLDINVKSTWQTSKIKNAISRRLQSVG